ncbi:unnamed protein product [Musa acuminata subsp. malaccensis]|uniref:(wild Malaysian banana) hypothetical protein n=1 Tax=Musa acuminata subsp. malaccensis TaxID=214687 RepID=A0A804KRT9_MUSAM|nr:PREDICTED: probable protein ABIL3 isoform X2 [Musa acuminata subsp. malaccensis]CAG1852287.1 unnamed protein product [Musa acuminata subsp. malaccensis]
METASPCASSGSASHLELSSSDDLPVQQSLLLSDGLEALRNMRSQLYSAAEYFELSYINDDRKETVMRTLKDYAVEAVVNAVDHLGSVSHKVNNLLNEEVDEVSVAESEVSCIEQRLRTCQACIDQEGLSQQSLLIRPPKYHKRYILQDESMVDCDRQAKLMYEELHPPTENGKLQQQQSACSATRCRPSPNRNARSSSPSPCPPLVREHSSSPSHNSQPASPLPQLEKISSKGRRDNSPLRASNPLTRARSAANRPPIPNSSKQYLLESQNSLPNCLHDERYNRKDTEQNPTKKKGFLKSLLMRNRSWTDESLYSYLDEY